MIGYVFMAFFLVIIGVWFFIQNLFYGYANFEYTLSSISFIFILLTPLLTMRLMAEENKQKTDQLLYTSPVTATSIVTGKFLAVLTIFSLVMAIACFFPLVLTLFGTIQLASAYTAIIAFLMLGAAYLAIGLFISSLTDSQVVAAVISFVVFLFTVLMDGIAGIFSSDNKTAIIIFTVILLIVCLLLYKMMHNLTIAIGTGIICEAALIIAYLFRPTIFDGSVRNVFSWLSVNSRFNNFTIGVFDLSAIVYYISITVLFIFLTVQVVKKKRWS
jgi:ABC-2 type transport system permease protein